MKETNSGNIRIITEDYRQDGEKSWPVRIYMPDKQGPFPAVLDVHGGAWSSGACGDNEKIDVSLAESGITVFAIECRKAPEFTYPAQVIDVNYATRWVKAHAAACNAFSENIGGLATSSGGHALFLSAMRPADERYSSIDLPGSEGFDAKLSYLVGAWPVLDPFGRYIFAKENNVDFLVKATESYFLDEDTMKEGNPLLALERGEHLCLPPALIIQGTADLNIPLTSVHRFVEAYRLAGGVVDLELFKNEPHGFACKPGTGADLAIERIKAFVAAQVAEKSSWVKSRAPTQGT